MTLRLGHLALGIAGLAVVLFLALLGRDVLRAGGPGPRWRLVAAGLALLAALGVAPLAMSASDPPAGQGPGGLDGSKEWKELQALAKEGEEIASGRRGLYPFTEKEKARLLERFRAALGEVDALVAAGELGRTEGALFLGWLGQLRKRVEGFRPTELENATCYKPMPLPDPAREAWARLEERLPLVRQLLESQTLHPRVLGKVVDALKQDRDALASGRELTPEQRKGLDELTAAIAALEKRL
jgi:hypothetical protein